ncbi:hypothetical protein EDB89DRAFT_1948296 [Lactarius sanguifluus]|nr:hypothetical protein EDB89DRAFT_1948296 [Lactarius sanguifluus]
MTTGMCLEIALFFVRFIVIAQMPRDDAMTTDGKVTRENYDVSNTLSYGPSSSVSSASNTSLTTFFATATHKSTIFVQ